VGAQIIVPVPPGLRLVYDDGSIALRLVPYLMCVEKHVE
jgi:hypothetical protein